MVQKPGIDAAVVVRGAPGRAPAVCLPGFAGDGRVFGPLAEALAPRRGTIAWHLPPGAPAAAAAALAPHLAALGPFHLVTGSFGGLVARCLPPLPLLSWATVGTLPGPDLAPPGVWRRAAALRALPAPLVRRAYRAHLRRALARDGVPEDLAAAICADVPGKEVLLARLDGIRAWDVGPLPSAPTLWLLGAADPEAPWSVAEVQARCPGVEVSHVPGGHRPFASHPGPLAARLEAFWASRSKIDG